MRKINIHLTLDQRGVEYCNAVNAGVKRITQSLIEFSPSSPMIPHVSLIMGQLTDSTTLDLVAKIAEQVASSETAPSFMVDGPYLENIRNRYVFSDVHGSSTFAAIKQALQSHLIDKYLTVQSDYTDQPH